MKRSNTIVENIEFLISMYKRDLELDKELTIELEEAYENIIIELETIIELSK